MENSRCYENENYDTQFLSSAFLRGMAFGKNIKAFKNGKATMSLQCREDILLAVKKAYIDMSPRTFIKDEDWWNNQANTKKNGTERRKEKEEGWQAEKNVLFEKLSGEFLKYFQQPCSNFNCWHQKICKYFLKKFKSILVEYGYDADESLKYGKAQKIVNMTFKYLFCFDDAQAYRKKFEACHMPIDSYILKWYNDVCDQADKCETAWSDLDKAQYDAIQEKIKAELGNYNPFLAEFYIWAEYNS